MSWWSEGKLNVKERDADELAGSQNLSSDVETFLSENDFRLNLDEFCRHGGSQGDIEISKVIAERSPNSVMIDGTFDISFEESYNNGCRDIHWSARYRGTGTFQIDLSAGEMSYKITADQVPDYRDLPDQDPQEPPYEEAQGEKNEPTSL